MPIIKEKNSVFRYHEENPFVDDNVLDQLIEQAKLSSTRQSRLCLHKSDASPIHEMIIVFYKNNTLHKRAHFHQHKDESFILIRGNLKQFLYDASGNIIETRQLNEKEGRLSHVTRGTIHSLEVESEIAIVYEMCQGPLDETDFVLPNWDD